MTDRDWNALHQQAKSAYDFTGGKALPPIKADSPDLLLIAAMNLRWDVVEQAQTEATQAYNAARSRRMAAQGDLDRYWQGAVNDGLQLKRSILMPGSKTPNEWEARLSIFRIALKARDHMHAYVDAHNLMSDDQRAEQYQQSVLRAQNREYQKNLLPPGSATASAPQFNAQAFLTDLTRRGIAVSKHGEAIHVRPREALCDQDRANFRDHKSALLASLGDHETF